MLNKLEAGTIGKGTPGVYEVPGMSSYSVFQQPFCTTYSFLLFSSSNIQRCVSPDANITKIWSSMSTAVELRTEI